MATLWVNSSEARSAVADSIGRASAAARSLRQWLQGDWAMIFSHPSDFQYQGLENDRWLSILRAEFQTRGVRPLACRQGGPGLDASWVSDLIVDYAAVGLESSHTALAQDIVDLPMRALRDELLGMGARFVLIVDEDLRRRGVLKYSTGRTSISPLDLLASIDVLRRRSSAQRIAA